MKVIEKRLIIVMILMVTPPLAPLTEISLSDVQFMVYKTVKRSITSEIVTDIATDMFNITTPNVKYAGGVYVVGNTYPKYLNVFEGSGSILYHDWKIHNPSYTPSLPSGEKAKIIAKSFLIKYGLMPKEAYFKGISSNTFINYDPITEETITKQNSLNVVFGFRTTDGIPIEGPGAKIKVVLGNGGEVIGFTYFWRDIQPYELCSAISESEAIQQFLSMFDVPVEVTSIRLAYWAELPPFVKQEYLEPYYIIDYQITLNGATLNCPTTKMPATRQTETNARVSLARESINQEDIIPRQGDEPPTKDPGGGGGGGTQPPNGPRDDSLNTEVGVWWVEAYPDKPLNYTQENAQGFKYWLVEHLGWTAKFDLGDDSAWEEHFKYGAAPGGGKDYLYADSVDFAYFAGHGGVVFADYEYAYLEFIVERDYLQFSSSNARWGGNVGGSWAEEADLEWIALAACETLFYRPPTSNPIDRWKDAFCGLHYILGFNTTMQDNPNLGYWFGFFLQGLTIRESWILATQYAQPLGKWAAYLRAYTDSANTLIDRLSPYQVSPDPYPNPLFEYESWQC